MATQLKSFGAKALGAFALLLCAGLTTGCATTDHNEIKSALNQQADFAIFVARETEREYLGPPPCRDDHICMGVLFKVTFEPLEWVAGNSSMKERTFEMVQPSNRLDDLKWLIHTRRDETGTWQIINREVITLEACLGAESGEDADDLNRTDSDWIVEQASEDEQVCFGRVYRP